MGVDSYVRSYLCGMCSSARVNLNCTFSHIYSLPPSPSLGTPPVSLPQQHQQPPTQAAAPTGPTSQPGPTGQVSSGATDQEKKTEEAETMEVDQPKSDEKKEVLYMYMILEAAKA